MWGIACGPYIDLLKMKEPMWKPLGVVQVNEFLQDLGPKQFKQLVRKGTFRQGIGGQWFMRNPNA